MVGWICPNVFCNSLTRHYTSTPSIIPLTPKMPSPKLLFLKISRADMPFSFLPSQLQMPGLWGDKQMDMVRHNLAFNQGPYLSGTDAPENYVKVSWFHQTALLSCIWDRRHQACSRCEHVEKSNRKNSNFKCRKYLFELHAYLNAARNIAKLGISEFGRLHVNQPNVAPYEKSERFEGQLQADQFIGR